MKKIIIFFSALIFVILASSLILRITGKDLKEKSLANLYCDQLEKIINNYKNEGERADIAKKQMLLLTVSEAQKDSHLNLILALGSGDKKKISEEISTNPCFVDN